MRLAHFSDLHLTINPLKLGLRDWFGKRATGYLNAKTGRKKHFREALPLTQALLQDIKARQVDHILFTGDATTLGMPEEFSLVKSVFGDDLPPGLAVPGNHDLTRPDPGDAAARGFDHYEEDPSLRRAALKRGSSTHKQLERQFAGYSKWWKRSILPALEERKDELQISLHPGVLPGDFLLKLTTGAGLRLGIVGCNSSFLQQRGGLARLLRPVHVRRRRAQHP